MSEECDIFVCETLEDIQESREINYFKCEECAFFTESSEDLETHNVEKHVVKEHSEINEINKIN